MFRREQVPAEDTANAVKPEYKSPRQQMKIKELKTYVVDPKGFGGRN